MTAFDVTKAACAWWMSKRPLRYSEKEHLDNPAVNCTSAAEQELAETVAAWWMRHGGEQ